MKEQTHRVSKLATAMTEDNERIKLAVAPRLLSRASSGFPAGVAAILSGADSVETGFPAESERPQNRQNVSPSPTNLPQLGQYICSPQYMQDLVSFRWLAPPSTVKKCLARVCGLEALEKIVRRREINPALLDQLCARLVSESIPHRLRVRIGELMDSLNADLFLALAGLGDVV